MAAQATRIMAAKCRTKPTDLSAQDADEWFANHVSLSHCKPKELWKLTKINARGHSSDWATMSRHHGALTDLVERSSGRVPRQKNLHKQFVSWMAANSLSWAVRDSERAILHLRTMLMSLLSKKNDDGKPPAKHEKLITIMEKLVVDKADGDDNPPKRPKCTAPALAALPQHEEEVVVVPIAKKPVPCIDIGSSQESVDIDSLEVAMFPSTPPPTRRLETVPGLAAPPQHVPGLAAQPQQVPSRAAVPQHVPGIEALPQQVPGLAAQPSKTPLSAAALVALSSVALVAPTPAEYTKLKANQKKKKGKKAPRASAESLLKRPAASGGPNVSQP